MVNKSGLISNIDELICVLDQDFEIFSNILDQIVGNVVKNTQHAASLISYINNKLSNASTRQKGLALLNATIPLCPHDIVAEHAVAWINNSLKYCENETEINYTSFKIIKPLLCICSKTPELNKAITSSILSKLVEEVISVNRNAIHSFIALECLNCCLRIYSGSCGPYKSNLEKYLILYIDSPLSSASVRMAGKCLHALQQVGGGGVERINHKQNWKVQQQRICATIHSLMDQFFESVTEFGDFQQDGMSTLELPKLSEGTNFQVNAYRIINTTIFLQEMLLGAYPVRKSILPGLILVVIARGLTVTSSTLGNHIVEDSVNLSSYLCLIHKHLLQLLQCLIISLGCNMIPNATLICKLLVNNLKSIPAQDAYLIKPCRDLRLTAYETLRLWLKVVKASSCVNMFLDALLPVLIDDITCAKTELSLTVQKSTPKNLNKKARKKLQEQVTNNFAAKAQSPMSGKFFTNDTTFQSDVCASALKTLQSLLSFEGSLMKPIMHKQLQEFVIKTLDNIQRGTVLCPYNNESCKIELYNTLTSLVINHHWNITPPLEYAINLLSKGQSDNEACISYTCSVKLASLNSFIHPAFATLQLPIDLDDLKSALNTERKKITHFEINIDESENDDEKITSVNEKPQEFDSKEVESITKNNVDTGTSVNEMEYILKEITYTSNNNVVEDTEITENCIKDCKYDESDIINLVENVPTQIDDTSTSSPSSIHIDISSDEEMMEQLTIEEQEFINKKVEDKINLTDEMNINEEEMCKSFVDIVNE